MFVNYSPEKNTKNNLFENRKRKVFKIFKHYITLKINAYLDISYLVILKF